MAATTTTDARPPSPGGDGAPLLAVDAVGKRFPGVVALDDVSLQIGRGEVHALVGENGAGKSTLIKVITGKYAPDAGEVRLAGAPVRFHSPREAQAAGISTIFQEVNLVPLMSAAQNVFLGREPRRRTGLIDYPRMRREAGEILARYGVAIDVTLPIRELGVGVQQMVAIARAVSIDARVVIMDEPTSSLEPREVDVLFGVIGRLRADGVAVIYVSHKLDELFRICDRVTVLRDGRVVGGGAMGDFTRLSLVATMLGRDASTVRREGATTFSERTADGAAAMVLEAHGLRRAGVLDGVSVDVGAGQIVGLGGLLGAGRSETARAIAGAMALDGGSVAVGGHAVPPGRPAAAVRAGIAMLPEDRKTDGIVPHLSVRENIVLAALPRLSRFGVVSTRRQDAIVETFMTRLRIKASSPDQRAGELSGGNQQKVMLARWLCLSPKVLLLDEPTRGIDVGAKAEVQALIDELADQGLAVLLISSEVEEMVEGADTVVVLREGAVVEVLTGDAVTEERLVGALAGEAAPR